MRQYKKEMPAFSVYQPADAYIANGGSELNGSNAEFDGTNAFRGVNPANGVVVYYNLPELKKEENITLEVRDSSRKSRPHFYFKSRQRLQRIRRRTRSGTDFAKIERLEQIRLGYALSDIPGVENVYIEASYRGHKASPGKYNFTVKMGGQNVSTSAEILANPMYSTSPATYKEYHQIMSAMETELMTMHRFGQ